MVAALVTLGYAPAATAQSYAQTNDTAQETYVIDSKGTTLYRNGTKVCRFNCAPVAAPVPRPTPPPAPVMRLSATPPATPPVTSRATSPVTPDRAVAADRYPPLLPTTTATATPAVWRPQTLPVAAPPPVAGIAQASAPAAAPAPKREGLTKEQKAVLLNAGGVLAITTYGLIFWDYFQTAPKADGEGWFGHTTKYGGADKLGHFWSTYTVGHLFSYVYRWWDFDRDQANALGAASSLGVQTLMEAGDAFSADYGFSYEDELMNIAGAGAAYILGKYPALARKIDFRFEYTPKKFSDLTNDFLTNYDNQRYLIALKLDGFDMFHDSILSYLELHAGYYTRGYEEWDPGDPDNRRRYFYFGAGINVSKLVQNFADIHVFDYVQVPYTSVGVRKGID